MNSIRLGFKHDSEKSLKRPSHAASDAIPEEGVKFAREELDRCREPKMNRR
jgi:hypothetical protein